MIPRVSIPVGLRVSIGGLPPKVVQVKFVSVLFILDRIFELRRIPNFAFTLADTNEITVSFNEKHFCSFVHSYGKP